MPRWLVIARRRLMTCEVRWLFTRASSSTRSTSMLMALVQPRVPPVKLQRDMMCYSLKNLPFLAVLLPSLSGFSRATPSLAGAFGVENRRRFDRSNSRQGYRRTDRVCSKWLDGSLERKSLSVVVQPSASSKSLCRTEVDPKTFLISPVTPAFLLS